MRKLKNKNFVVPALLFISASLYFIYSTRQLEFGTIEKPGPGFFPFTIAILELIVGILLLVRNFKND